MSKSNTETVKVMVRIRPMNKKEIERGSYSVSKVDGKNNTVELKSPDANVPLKNFAYDSVYDCDSLQSDVYNECAFPLVESVIEGYNGTIFAYG